MIQPAMMTETSRPTRITGACAMVAAATSCATGGRSVDHRHYQKTPDPPSTILWRTIARSTPWTAKRAFYGNWGGPGNKGGKPVDRMDEGFRRHDLVYDGAGTGRVLRAADRELLAWLEAVDESGLSEEGRDFRRRAIGFIRSPWACQIGKPFLSDFLWSEPRWSCFRSPADVAAFFDPDNSGFPPRRHGGSDAGPLDRGARPPVGNEGEIATARRQMDR